MASNAEIFFIWWRHHVENYIFKINATSPIGQWVNSSPPSAAYVCVSELGQCWFRWWLVACSVPSHHLHQPYLIVNWTPGNKLQWNSNRSTKRFIDENVFENVAWQIGSHFVQQNSRNIHGFCSQLWMQMTIIKFQINLLVRQLTHWNPCF